MSGQQILLVADSPEGVDTYVPLLQQAGYNVTLAEDSTAPPPADLLFVDVTRFRFSPFASLQAQRRMGAAAPAVLLSPRITEQMAAEMFDLGVRDFVLKPIENDALLARLETFIRRIAQERNLQEANQRLERTEAALARRLEEMQTLSRIGRAIATLTDIDTMLTHIVDAAVFLTHAEEGAIFLLQESSNNLMLRAHKGLGDKNAEAIRQPSTDSDAMEALRTGQPIQKSADGEHKVKTGFLVRAQINVPIVIGRQVKGVVAVYNHGTRSFTASDQAVLINLADYAAIAMDKVNSLRAAEARTENASKASREVALHVETFVAPIEGIESLANTLLSGGFGPLTEQQHTAVSRIKQATVRLNEIMGYIDQAISNFKNSQPAG